MKTAILAIAAASLASVAAAAEPEQTVYGDVARVVSSVPVYAKAPAGRECRLEPTGFRVAANEDGPAGEVDPCDDKGATRERVVAYDVTYEYNGHSFRMRLPYDPGERLAVNVIVRPPLPRDVSGPRFPRYRGPY